MSLTKYRNALIDGSGNAIEGASVTVTIYGTATAADLFTDALGAFPVSGNVVLTDARGTFSFYADEGRYDMAFSLNGESLGEDLDVTIIGADTAPAERSLITFGCPMNGVDSDSAGLRLAIEWSNANLATVRIPLGVVVHDDGSQFTEDFVSLQGSGMPTRNAGETELIGGTVIRGRLSLRGKNISVADLGVDRGSANNGTASDALVISNAAGERAHVQNVVALGRSSADVAHAILIEGFAHLTGGNTVGVHNYYGHAIKVQRSNFGNITSVSNDGYGVIIKHDKDYNGTGKSVFGNVLVVGNATTEFAVQVLCLNTGATDLEMRDISIGDVVFTGVQYGCAVVGDMGSTGAVVMENIRFGNITGSATVAGFYTYAYPGAFIGTVSRGDLLFTPSGNSAAVESSDGVFQLITGKTVAAMPSGTTHTTDAILIGTGVYRYTSDGISLPLAYTAANAGVSFNGTEGRVEGICAFESYGANPIRRTGLRSPGTPSSGRYVAGEFLWNNGPALDGSNMSILGWSRITTGSAHVMGTDWARANASHVSPAA